MDKTPIHIDDGHSNNSSEANRFQQYYASMLPPDAQYAGATATAQNSPTVGALMDAYESRKRRPLFTPIQLHMPAVSVPAHHNLSNQLRSLRVRDLAIRLSGMAVVVLLFCAVAINWQPAATPSGNGDTAVQAGSSTGKPLDTSLALSGSTNGGNNTHNSNSTSKSATGATATKPTGSTPAKTVAVAQASTVQSTANPTAPTTPINTPTSPTPQPPTGSTPPTVSGTVPPVTVDTGLPLPTVTTPGIGLSL